MDKFYKKLPSSKKRSLTFSMRTLSNDFLESYDHDLSSFKTKDAMINDLYFYWLRNSAERRYLWCEELSENVFSDSFTREMKKKLKNVFLKLLKEGKFEFAIFQENINKKKTQK